MPGMNSKPLLRSLVPARVLVAARLSRVVRGRDQLSIERQDESARRYAAEAGDPEPILAADAGVSGSVSPFKRPALGRYLTDPELLGQWDEIVASAIDRLGRNARDLADLRAFAEDHGKRITILSPRLHWPPAPDDFASGLIWDVLARLAEIELRLTSKRYADTRAYLRERHSLIGKAPWGFRIIGTKAAKTLAPDPVKVPYLLGMIDRAIAGQTLLDIARWLDSENVKPRRGEQWEPVSVSRILRNESLYGVRKHNGSVLLRHVGVINRDRFNELQSALDAKPTRRGPTRNEPAMLSDVLYCGKCQRVMHYRRMKGGTGGTWIGYRCDGTAREPSTCRNMITARDIESWVDQWFTTSRERGGFGYADVEIVETVNVPASGHAEEVAEIESEIRDLDLDAPDADRRFTELRAARAELLAMGTTLAHTEDRPTGVTLGEYWPTLTATEKRDYLRRAGVKVYGISVKSTVRDARAVGQDAVVIGPVNAWLGEASPERVMGKLARKPVWH